MSEKPGAVSLAQGVVHWQPPSSALQKAAQLLQEGAAISSYGPDEGLPALRECLKVKLAEENKLQNVRAIQIGLRCQELAGTAVVDLFTGTNIQGW